MIQILHARTELAKLNYMLVTRVFIALTNAAPRGTVYSVMVALKKPMKDNKPITTSVGMPKPTGGGYADR